MTIVWAILLLLTAVIGWVLTLFGAPGNWISVVAVAIYAWLMPNELRVSIGWPIVVGTLLLAILGEVLEFAAGAFGVAKTGGTWRGGALAIVGSLIGGVVGMFVGLPVPLIGSVVAILLFASVGALGGAMLGEVWAGRTWEESWPVGHAAFWGRLFGTLGKIMAGSVIVALIAMGLLLK
ncbi:MAG: DUF456 domain-containing protein [Planctomycetales bacterium]|nr:DUF456 domain-containing protein [Planctomycetales bacterium]